jgi:hypothetical protein
MTLNGSRRTNKGGVWNAAVSDVINPAMLESALENRAIRWDDSRYL